MRGRDLKTTDMGLCCQQRRGYIRQRIRGWLIRAEDKEVPQSTRFGEEWRETEDSQRGLERSRRSCRRRGAGSDGSHGESCSESLQKRHETEVSRGESPIGRWHCETSGNVQRQIPRKMNVFFVKQR